jgi:YesN/AraC family two-component response regulator
VGGKRGHVNITLPGASSREVVAEAAKIRRDIKVIVTSAYSQEMIKDIMKIPQVRSFLRKPFQRADLEKKLRDTLST